jgi:hypothetical protein
LTFSVEVDRLRDLPTMMDRLGEDASKGKSYVTDNTKVSWQGLLNNLTGGHEHAVSTVTTFLDAVQSKVAKPTGAATQAAISYYQHTDARAAERMDAQYRHGEAPPPEDYTYYEYTHGTSFHDVGEPEDYYEEPEDYSGEFPYEPHWGDATSPAQVSRDIVYEATAFCAKIGICDRAYDPYEDLVRPFVGDWAGFRACKDVFDNVANACVAMGSNMHWAARSIETCWTGDAAAACESYLLEVDKALGEAAEPIREIGEQYEKAAEGAHELGMVLGDAISSLIDACILCAADAALGAATSETVVGGLLFGGAAAYEAYKVYKELNECFELVRQARALVELANSTLNGLGGIEGGVTLPALPQAAPALPGGSS